MRKTLIIIALLLSTCFAFGQKKRAVRPPGPPTKEEEAKIDLHYRCLHTNKYSAKQRKAFFPFSTAASIKLISFEAPMPPDVEIQLNDGKIIGGGSKNADTVDVISPMAPGRFVINFHKVKEEKMLRTAGINSLTDILYNVGYTPVKNLTLQIAEVSASCYEPRNAILFLDSAGNVSQYIEICFTCHRYYYSSSKTVAVEYCEQKFDMLRRFFRKQHIMYGTAKNFEN